MPQVVVKDLTVGYLDKNSENIVLENFNATFEDRKINVILGESGCGKTTLLKTIIGFYDYEGQIFFDGVDIINTPVQERNLSYISQKYALYPHMTVFDNIAYPLKILRAPREEIIERVYDLSNKLGITDFLSRKPKCLSGGQLQRVAIARALIKRPALLLCDEPLSNQDKQTDQEIRILFKKTLSELGTTAIYVTHNFEDAFALADKMFVIKNKKIEVSGTPQKVLGSNSELISYYKKQK